MRIITKFDDARGAQTQSCGLYLWPHALQFVSHLLLHRHRRANDKFSGGIDTHLPLSEDLNSGAGIREGLSFILSGEGGVCPFFSEEYFYHWHGLYTW